MKDRKLVAITGSTGGLGKRVCLSLAESSDFIFIDRNREKSEAFTEEIKKRYPCCEISFVTCELSDEESVKNAVNALIGRHIDVLLLNSGVYNVPIYKTNSGFNNVFTVNFLSQYYLARKLVEGGSLKKVVAVGSVAHRYGKIDEKDVDFSLRTKSSKIYGNSKRFLMFALYEYFKGVSSADLAIAHPGVTLTNMTNHYPKLINPIVRLGIKVLFPSPDNAIRSILAAVGGENCGYHEWIGPRVFDVWGKPKKKILKSCSNEESEAIGRLTEEMYSRFQ